MRIDWWIDGEDATSAEVRAVVLRWAGGQGSPSEARELVAGELAIEGYADCGGVAVEVDWDELELDERRDVAWTLLVQDAPRPV